MPLITLTEATEVSPQPGDRKIVVNTSEISRIEPGQPDDIGKSFIYLRDGKLLQVHETQQQIIQLSK